MSAAGVLQHGSTQRGPMQDGAGGDALTQAFAQAFGQMFPHVDWPEIGQGIVDTLAMLGGSLALTALLGLPLGVLLFLSGQRAVGQARPQRPVLYGTLSFAVNILRSVPFIILMILLIPLAKTVMGTSLGVRGAILPLVIGTAPFYARLVETALREIDRGVIEASQAMGATTGQIVFGVLLPEARPGLVAGLTVTAIALVSYTAMGGTIGAGGLGDLAYRYGYQRNQHDVTFVTVLLLLVLVQALQLAGDRLVVRFSRR